MSFAALELTVNCRSLNCISLHWRLPPCVSLWKKFRPNLRLNCHLRSPSSADMPAVNALFMSDARRLPLLVRPPLGRRRSGPKRHYTRQIYHFNSSTFDFLQSAASRSHLLCSFISRFRTPHFVPGHNILLNAAGSREVLATCAPPRGGRGGSLTHTLVVAMSRRTSHPWLGLHLQLVLVRPFSPLYASHCSL